jgi:hypothetical protein
MAKEEFFCSPWEIEPEHSPLYWMVRRMRLDTLMKEIHG